MVFFVRPPTAVLRCRCRRSSSENSSVRTGSQQGGLRTHVGDFMAPCFTSMPSLRRSSLRRRCRRRKRRNELRDPAHTPASHVRADAAFSAVINAYRVDAGTIAISATTVWLRDLFGKGTPERTALAPHHTDTCSECVIFTTTGSCLRMSLPRHKQQADRTLERMSAS
jgi:hypothetical protein